LPVQRFRGSNQDEVRGFEFRRSNPIGFMEIDPPEHVLIEWNLVSRAQCST
jgi:hypothetical protein